VSLISKSKSATTQVTDIQDSRVSGSTGVIASGGGSVAVVETIPVEPLALLVGAIQDSDIRRSTEAREIVATTTRASSETVRALAAQRTSETETLGSTISTLGPILLGLAALLLLTRR